MMKGLRGADDRYVIEALQRTIELYTAWGRPEKLAEYRSMRPE